LPRQKSRFDELVDKLSQLGVERIIPMVTERVVVRWDSASRERHHQRWCKIAKQACMQSGRNDLPVLEPVKEFSEVLADAADCELKLIPTLSEKKNNLKEESTSIYLSDIAKHVLLGSIKPKPGGNVEQIITSIINKKLGG